jgi:hypothetical protein
MMRSIESSRPYQGQMRKTWEVKAMKEIKSRVNVTLKYEMHQLGIGRVRFGRGCTYQSRSVILPIGEGQTEKVMV